MRTAHARSRRAAASRCPRCSRAAATRMRPPPRRKLRTGTMAKTIIVEQTGSPIRRPADQRQTLVGLGLNKLRRRATLQDTPEVRGMIAKVQHLVRVLDES